MNVEELKNKTRKILGGTKFITLVGEKERVTFLMEIIEKEIVEDKVEELNEKLDEISKYLIEKQERMIKEKDFEYLKNLAEILRSQKVRIEDGVCLENPVFKVTIDEENGKNSFYFLTKEGADKFIEYNSFMTKNLHTEKTDNSTEDDRRKEAIFNVEKNKNLELERLIEIIKRNF